MTSLLRRWEAPIPGRFSRRQRCLRSAMVAVLGRAAAPGDPVRMAARIIQSVDVASAPLRMMLGSPALEFAGTVLRGRAADIENRSDLGASTRLRPGE